MEEYNAYKELIETYGWKALVVILFIIILVIPDRLKIWVGWLQVFIAYIFKICKKSSIKNRLEGYCSIALKKIGREFTELDIPDLKIEWVKEHNLISKLEEGKAIVKLKFSVDQSTNTYRAISIFVKDTFLYRTKPYLSPSLRKSIDFSMIRKVLLSIEGEKTNILNLFFKETENETIQLTSELSQIKKIDDYGLFSRILIRELDNYGNILYGTQPLEDHFKETEEFLNFVYGISIRDYDEQTPLKFDKENLKVCVILVAKKETYLTYGKDAYLRRIKLGFAQGIKTFYLLAREDKVEILKEVVSELLATGNFTCVNKPQEYQDSKKRSTICYCIVVNTESTIAKSYKNISDSIITSSFVEGVITKIRYDGLKVDIDGVEGFVKQSNLSKVQLNDVKDYFKVGTIIELIPIEITSSGIVEFSLIGTQSDPYVYIQSNFAIGQTITGKVLEALDNYIKVDIGDGNLLGSALRSNLTFSKFAFLHQLYQVGCEYQFIIIEINFEHKQLYLKSANLKDPWENFHKRIGEKVKMLVCVINNNRFCGEISDGIEVNLPFSELAWFDVDNIKSTIKRNDEIDCYVKYINYENRFVYVTLKDPKNNPYVAFCDKNLNHQILCNLIEEDSAGVYGLIENKYRVFVPHSELGWKNMTFGYRIGKQNKTTIIGVSERGDSLIGSFKSQVIHPLTSFCEKYPVGTKFNPLKIKERHIWGLIFELSLREGKQNLYLFRDEIANNVYISSCIEIFKNIDALPVVVKEINLEKENIICSLREILISNLSNLELSYDDCLEVIILNKKREGYITIILGNWVQALLESEHNYQVGDKVKVRASLIKSNEVILTDY